MGRYMRHPTEVTNHGLPRVVEGALQRVEAGVF